MRAACLVTILLAGCSSLLGIEDPRARDAGSIDEGGGRDHLEFRFGDFHLAPRQTARLHVELVLAGGTRQDVTSSAAYSSGNDAVATVAAAVVSASALAGTATITATLGSAAPASVKVTVGGATCHPVINEVATGGSTGADEWVELYNPCVDPVDVSGWTLVYRAANNTGATDTSAMAALTGTMAPGDLRLYAGTDYKGTSDGTWPDPSGIMQQVNGAVGLRAGPVSTAPLVDSVAYGTINAGHPFLEASPSGAMANGRSASRLPFDGNDTNDGAADFVVSTTQTPRVLNAP